MVALIPKQIELDGQTVDAHEDTDLRAANAKHFVLADGRRAVVIQQGQHYADRDTGQWEETSNAVVAEARPDGFSQAVSRVPLRVRFGPRGRHRIGFGVGQYLTLSAADVAAVVQPVAEGNKVTYPGLWPDADLIYEHGVERVKESIVLRSPNAPASFRFRVAEKGNVSLRPADDGSIEVVDASGAALGRMLAPFCEDANGERGGATLAYDGAYLTVTLDATWLADPARAWPVVVDPTTITFQPGSEGVDTYVASDSAGSNYGDNAVLFLGVTDSTVVNRQPWLWVDTSRFSSGATITSAQLQLYLASLSYNVSGLALTPKSADGSWTESGLTWNNRPASGNWTGTAVNSGTTTAVWYTWDVTALVQSWVNGTRTNNGMMIQHAANSNHWLGQFASGDYTTDPTKRPKWVVTYTPDPTASITSPNGTQASPTTINDDVTPTLSGVYTGGYQMTTRQHQIHDEAGNLIWDSGEVADTKTSGQTVSVTVPTAASLKYGTLYRWRWRAKDGSGTWSAWTANGTGDGCWFRSTLTAPTGLSATADAANAEIDLSWTAHTGENLAGYNVYRRKQGDAAWTKINLSLVTGTTCSDNTAASGQAYEYAITAQANDGFESDKSTAASATVTFTGAWLNDLQVRLRRSPLIRHPRMASARLSLSGRWIVQDRGFAPRVAEIEVLYQSKSEREAIQSLLAADTLISYRDEAGEVIRGKVTAGAQLDALWSIAGFWPVQITEETAE